MKGNKSKGKLQTQPEHYKRTVKRGDNISTRIVEFMIRGGRPWWQVAHGETIESWSE